MSAFGLQIAQGQVAGRSVVHKFGFNEDVGTTLEAISQGGIYRMPLPASATKLRVKAGNVADTAAGAGARSVLLEGLDATGAAISETVPTAGVSAGADSTLEFLRLFRATVATSGTQADVTADSHVAAVVIEKAAGSEDWATIAILPSPLGQSQIAAYSVPLNKTVFIHSIHVQVESSILADIGLYTRNNILTASAPFSALRSILNLGGIADSNSLRFEHPMKFDALTDIVFMGLAASSTPKIAVDFEMTLLDS